MRQQVFLRRSRGGLLLTVSLFYGRVFGGAKAGSVRSSALSFLGRLAVALATSMPGVRLAHLDAPGRCSSCSRSSCRRPTSAAPVTSTGVLGRIDRRLAKRPRGNAPDRHEHRCAARIRHDSRLADRICRGSFMVDPTTPPIIPPILFAAVASPATQRRRRLRADRCTDRRCAPAQSGAGRPRSRARSTSVSRSPSSSANARSGARVERADPVGARPDRTAARVRSARRSRGAVRPRRLRVEEVETVSAVNPPRSSRPAGRHERGDLDITDTARRRPTVRPARPRPSSRSSTGRTGPRTRRPAPPRPPADPLEPTVETIDVRQIIEFPEPDLPWIPPEQPGADRGRRHLVRRCLQRPRRRAARALRYEVVSSVPFQDHRTARRRLLDLSDRRYRPAEHPPDSAVNCWRPAGHGHCQQLLNLEAFLQNEDRWTWADTDHRARRSDASPPSSARARLPRPGSSRLRHRRPPAWPRPGSWSATASPKRPRTARGFLQTIPRRYDARNPVRGDRLGQLSRWPQRSVALG